MEHGCRHSVSQVLAAALLVVGTCVPAPANAQGESVNGVRRIEPAKIKGLLVTGYPLMRGKYSAEETKLGRNERIKSHVDLALYIDLAVLRRWPEIFDDDRLAYSYASRFLREDAVQKWIAGCRYGKCSSQTPYDGWAGANEFEREGSYRSFVQEMRPALIALAPDLPLSVLQVLDVTVQPYDGARGIFPLQVPRQAPFFATVPPATQLLVTSAFTPPLSVPVARTEAPSWLAKLPSSKRTAFLGLELSLVVPDAPTQLARRELQLVLKNAGLYADPDLEAKLHAFKLWETR
jgi:hypothetical protein